MKKLLTALVLSLLIAGAFGAQGAGALTRNPELPDKPRNIADLFVADTYQVNDVPVVDWFCRPGGQASGRKICSSNSQQAFFNLIGQMVAYPNEGKPTLLRAGKARDDCTQSDNLQACGTGVPSATPCPQFNSTPYCALRTLKEGGIHAGVVVGARDTAGGGRPVKDIAWQACQINTADTEELYDFMFLDQAAFLGGDIERAVEYINEGRVWSPKESAWVVRPSCNQGWDVITNDNNWRSQGYTLDTQAWGHAKHYEVAETFGSLTNAARNQIGAITANDRDFTSAVGNLTPPQGLTTGAVLRVEVTEQTDILSRIPNNDQCVILRRWAAAQNEPGYRYASLFPLYNAGFDFTDKPDTEPYDSYAEGTGLRQLDLMKDPEGPASAACPT